MNLHRTARHQKTRTASAAGRAWAAAAPVAVATIATVAGCGQQGGAAVTSPTASATASATARPSQAMKGMDMGGDARPSQPATMICSAEIRDAVKRTFALPKAVAGQGSWNAGDRVYSCTYRLPDGVVRLSVQDALTTGQGTAYFRTQRDQLTGARSIRGVEGFGLPSLQTPTGQVAFLKDGKTLLVDATGVPTTGLPKGYTRAESAYAIAAAVVACWSE